MSCYSLLVMFPAQSSHEQDLHIISQLGMELKLLKYNLGLRNSYFSFFRKKKRFLSTLNIKHLILTGPRPCKICSSTTASDSLHNIHPHFFHSRIPVVLFVYCNNLTLSLFYDIYTHVYSFDFWKLFLQHLSSLLLIHQCHFKFISLWQSSSFFDFSQTLLSFHNAFVTSLQ